MLLQVLAYTAYGRSRTIAAVAWGAVVANCLLIIASRKHYTVDVVVAWYAVPLVFWQMHGYVAGLGWAGLGWAGLGWAVGVCVEGAIWVMGSVGSGYGAPFHGRTWRQVGWVGYS